MLLESVSSSTVADVSILISLWGMLLLQATIFMQAPTLRLGAHDVSM
jgi:hypothetical protein